jgi:CBS domain-containing protein
VIRGRLRLENERVLSFEARPGTAGCAFEDWSSELHPQREHVGAGASVAEGPSQGPSSTGASGTALGTAADIMSRNVVTVSRDMLVEDAAKLLAFHSISGMPVEDWDGKVVGIVSEADVIGKIGDTVDDVMTREVISVPDTATIEEIAALMADKRIKRVPVMSNGALLGMISRADIVRALAARA